jgi:long-chain acyl-CoA synthetase
VSDTTETKLIASTVSALPASAAERFGDNLAARYKAGDEWRDLNYSEVGEAIQEIALGLVALGVEPGDRVCILSDTRLEWTLASYGISAAGAVVVPIYPTNSPGECQWVAGNSGAKAVFCENEQQSSKIEQVKDELPELEHVIGIESGGGSSLEQLRERGRNADRGALASRQERVSPEDPYTIVYTSGTTGPPKGVVLTHANAMTVCSMVEELDIVQPGEMTYLYLPLAHVFALTAQLASFDQGTTIVFYGGDTKKILAEIREAVRSRDQTAGKSQRGGPGALPDGHHARHRGAAAPSARRGRAG